MKIANYEIEGKEAELTAMLSHGLIEDEAA